MSQHTNNPHDSETSRWHMEERRLHLKEEHWNRAHSAARALEEGFSLEDEHWEVIKYLRKYYLTHGTPRHARTLARDLNHHFAPQGGSMHLHRLFNGGPVSQGSRLANLRIPHDATNPSFGTRY